LKKVKIRGGKKKKKGISRLFRYFWKRGPLFFFFWKIGFLFGKGGKKKKRGKLKFPKLGGKGILFLL